MTEQLHAAWEKRLQLRTQAVESWGRSDALMIRYRQLLGTTDWATLSSTPLTTGTSRYIIDLNQLCASAKRARVEGDELLVTADEVWLRAFEIARAGNIDLTMAWQTRPSGLVCILSNCEEFEEPLFNVPVCNAFPDGTMGSSPIPPFFQPFQIPQGAMPGPPWAATMRGQVQAPQAASSHHGFFTPPHTQHRPSSPEPVDAQGRPTGPTSAEKHHWLWGELVGSTTYDLTQDNRPDALLDAAKCSSSEDAVIVVKSSLSATHAHKMARELNKTVNVRVGDQDYGWNPISTLGANRHVWIVFHLPCFQTLEELADDVTPAQLAARGVTRWRHPTPEEVSSYREGLAMNEKRKRPTTRGARAQQPA